MNTGRVWIGFLGTMLIIIVLGFAIWTEPERQERTAEELLNLAILAGMDVYAENCAVCHGAGGSGLATFPALDDDGVRSMEYEDLLRTIERGRPGTGMAAYALEEGGILTPATIDTLIALIRHAEWPAVATRVNESGLTPPDVVDSKIDEEMVAQLAELPGGDLLADAMGVYIQNCAACHGNLAEGSAIAPALDTPEIRTMSPSTLMSTIESGVPGTLMAGWRDILNQGDLESLVPLLQRWDELNSDELQVFAEGIPALDINPESIRMGAQLYDVTCARCHGTEGFGTRMAPALNNQLFLSETPDSAIQQIIMMGMPGTSMPAWGDYFSEADILALNSFLRNWEPTAPAIVDPQTSGSPGGPGPPWR